MKIWKPLTLLLAGLLATLTVSAFDDPGSCL